MHIGNFIPFVSTSIDTKKLGKGIQFLENLFFVWECSTTVLFPFLSTSIDTIKDGKSIHRFCKFFKYPGADAPPAGQTYHPRQSVRRKYHLPESYRPPDR